MKIYYTLKNKNIVHSKSNTDQAFWVVLGSLSSFSLAIVSAAILSRYLDKQEYGTYRQIVYIYTTLLIIFGAGLPEVFAYFLPRFSLEEGKYIVRKITITLFISGGVFSFFLFAGSGFIADFLNNPGLEKGLRIFSPIPLMLLPTLGIEGIFSTYRKTIFIGIYNTLTRILMLLFIVVPVIVFKGTYETAIYGWLIVSLISLFIAFYFKGIPFKGVNSRKADLTYKSVFAYSLPLVFASIWGVAIRSADQFYISRFFGAKTFAEFANGFIQLPFVTMVTGATSMVLMPVFSRMVHENAPVSEITVLWKSALIKSAKIIYPLTLFFIFFANDIIIILFSKMYMASILYFRINMVLNLFNIIVFAPLMYSLGKTKLYARIHMLLAFAVWGLECAAIYIFHSPIAVAIVSVSLGISAIIICLFYTSRILEVSIYRLVPVKEVGKIMLHVSSITIIIKIVMIFCNIYSSILELAIAVLLFTLTIILTSTIVSINYLDFATPLLRKNKRFLSLISKDKSTWFNKILSRRI